MVSADIQKRGWLGGRLDGAGVHGSGSVLGQMGLGKAHWNGFGSVLGQAVLGKGRWVPTKPPATRTAGSPPRALREARPRQGRSRRVQEGGTSTSAECQQRERGWGPHDHATGDPLPGIPHQPARAQGRRTPPSRSDRPWYPLTSAGLGDVQSSSRVTGGYWEPQPSLVKGVPVQSKS